MQKTIVLFVVLLSFGFAFGETLTCDSVSVGGMQAPDYYLVKENNGPARLSIPTLTGTDKALNYDISSLLAGTNRVGVAACAAAQKGILADPEFKDVTKWDLGSYSTAPSFVGSTTVAGTSVAVPSGVQAGDLVIVVCTADSTSDADTNLPADFSLLASENLSVDNQAIAISYKVLTGSDTGTYDCGVTSGVAQAYAFRSAGTPVATENVYNSGAASPITITATGTTAAVDDILLWVGATDFSASGIYSGFTQPSGFTSRQNTANTYSWAAGATKTVTSAGATGDITGQLTLTSGAAGWVGYLIKIPSPVTNTWENPSNGGSATKTADGTYPLAETNFSVESGATYEIAYFLNRFYTGTITPDIGGVSGTTRTFSNGLNEMTGISVGTDATKVKTDAAIWYAISGTSYYKAATDNIALGTDVVPTGKWGAVALDIGADGTIDAVSATGNSTGYYDEPLARAGLPAAASDHVRIGSVAVTKSDGSFTFGTTAFNAENVAFLPYGHGLNMYYFVDRITTTGTAGLSFVPSSTARLGLYLVRVAKVGATTAADRCSRFSSFGINNKTLNLVAGGALSLGGGGANYTGTLTLTSSATGWVGYQVLLPKSGTASYIHSTSAASAVTNVPTGVQAGNVVILACTDDWYSTFTYPSGFTELKLTDIAGDIQSVGVAYKTLSGSDSGTYTCTNSQITQAYAFRGVATPSITENKNEEANASPVSIVASGISVWPGDIILWLGASDFRSSDIYGSFTPPENFTTLQNQASGWSWIAGAMKTIGGMSNSITWGELN